jgi:hypothetical protein
MLANWKLVYCFTFVPNWFEVTTKQQIIRQMTERDYSALAWNITQRLVSSGAHRLHQQQKARKCLQVL